MRMRLPALAGRALAFLAIAMAFVIAPFGCGDSPKSVAAPAGDFPAIKKANENMENFAKLIFNTTM
jgi:hypothetical protein